MAAPSEAPAADPSVVPSSQLFRVHRHPRAAHIREHPLRHEIGAALVRLRKEDIKPRSHQRRPDLLTPESTYRPTKRPNRSRRAPDISPRTKRERRANTRRWRAHRALGGHQSARTNSTRKHSNPHRQSQGSTMLTLQGFPGSALPRAPLYLYACAQDT